MIHGIGTDIVSVKRIQEGLDKHGERFARRILAGNEMAGFRQAANPASYLAKRFAAKEAAVKALGTGFSEGISMGHVCVTHNARGKPLLEMSGRALALCEENEIGESHISISDEREYAVAFVTLLKKYSRGG